MPPVAGQIPAGDPCVETRSGFGAVASRAPANVWEQILSSSFGHISPDTDQQSPAASKPDVRQEPKPEHTQTEVAASLTPAPVFQQPSEMPAAWRFGFPFSGVSGVSIDTRTAASSSEETATSEGSSGNVLQNKTASPGKPDLPLSLIKTGQEMTNAAGTLPAAFLQQAALPMQKHAPAIHATTQETHSDSAGTPKASRTAEGRRHESAPLSAHSENGPTSGPVALTSIVPLASYFDVPPQPGSSGSVPEASSAGSKQEPSAGVSGHEGSVDGGSDNRSLTPDAPEAFALRIETDTGGRISSSASTAALHSTPPGVIPVSPAEQVKLTANSDTAQHSANAAAIFSPAQAAGERQDAPTGQPNSVESQPGAAVPEDQIAAKTLPHASNLQFQVTTEANQRVAVQMTGRGGELHVSVRTADPVLTQTLQAHLPDLVSSLNQQHMKAEVRPAFSESAQGNHNSNDSQSSGQRNPNQQDRQEESGETGGADQAQLNFPIADQSDQPG